MRTRWNGVSANGGGAGRRGRLRRERRGDGAGWRSHTFSDGLCSITLTAALDTETADRLRGRLRELGERGCDRLIVDVSAAVAPGTEAPALLARVFQAQPPSCEVVVVLARDSALDGLLPARIAVAWSLSDARRLLAFHSEQRGARQRLAPAGAISPGDRHALAVRQALRWAAQAAGAGDYERALRGLTTIERVEGALSEGWQERRQAWLVASRGQDTATPRPPGLGPGRV
jgi:hypothetical protein